VIPISAVLDWTTHRFSKAHGTGLERLPDGFREAVSEYFRQFGSGKKQ
jgi:hypothetical protein